jgi:hypothetical protein
MKTIWRKIKIARSRRLSKLSWFLKIADEDDVHHTKNGRANCATPSRRDKQA